MSTIWKNGKYQPLVKYVTLKDLKKLSNAIDIINGDSDTKGSIKKAIKDLVGEAPEAYDTLKEIADKLKSDDDLHKALNDAIILKASSDALNTEINRATSAETANKNAIDSEVTRARSAEKSLQDQITSNDSDITNLTAKHEILSRTVQGIAATGGASTATNVTYDNNASRLNAENAQDAIDELQASKIDKTSILQESGNAKDKVMSQNAISTVINAETKRAKEAEKALTNEVNKIAIYNLDTQVPLSTGFYTANTAHAAVPSSVRKKGLIIIYNIGYLTCINEQYIGDSVADTYWTNNNNWEQIPNTQSLLFYNRIYFANQSINKINKDTDYIYGYHINSNGVKLFNDSSVCSKIIDITGYTTFYSSAYAYGYIVLGWDKDFNFLGQIAQSNGIYTAESNVKYIRITKVNSINLNNIFIYTDKTYVKYEQIYNSTIYDYGITSYDIDSVETKKTIEKNSENIATLQNSVLEIEKSVEITDKKADVVIYNGEINLVDIDKLVAGYINTNTGTFIPGGKYVTTPYIYIQGCKIVNSNCSWSGSKIYMYDKDFNFIGIATEIKKYNNMPYNNGAKVYQLTDNSVYIRAYFLPKKLNEAQMYWPYIYTDRQINNYIPFGVKTGLPYLGKKLVTIGDSITYGNYWQQQLCRRTGMLWRMEETIGVENWKDAQPFQSFGWGYVKLDSELNDTDEYFEEVEGIAETEETKIDGFGFSHKIYTDTNGNKYRKPFRMAEGGETIMPVRTTSIYSRAADSKYYKGDVIILFGGANDSMQFIKNYPTAFQSIDKIKGFTNLKTYEEDNTVTNYEIYNDDAILSVDGNFTEEGETTGKHKYNATFRACYRGTVKRIIDGNPHALVICVGIYPRFNTADTYINRVDQLKIKEMNNIIEETARDFCCRYVNLSKIFGNYPIGNYLKSEGGYIHPSERGGNFIGDYIASEIFGN